MIKIMLRELMWDRDDVTAMQVHEATGISMNTLTLIKKHNHTNVKLETVDKLCKFFKCNISDLLEFTDI
ncbi:MAG: helix-turn-helix transcriptional regulator [Heliobacteriaceae bacterium]|jgi:putative transcriptional regulator|nr:helix-turn-helix transcriptional regulator [Heliobacteriaceae bacterium]